MAASLANAAVGDDRLAAVDAGIGIELLQIGPRFESAVLIDRLAPRHIDRAGNMARTHGQLGHTRRRKHLALVFVGRADIHQLRGALALYRRQRIAKAGAQIGVDLAHAVGGGGVVRCAVVQRAVLGLPLLAAAIEQLDVLDPIHIKHPGAPGRKPVVGIAIKHDGGVVAHATLGEQLLKRLLADNVAAHLVIQIVVPGEVDRTRNMRPLIQPRVHAHLDHPHIGPLQVGSQPFGADQRARRHRLRRVGKGRASAPNGCRDGAGNQNAPRRCCADSHAVSVLQYMGETAAITAGPACTVPVASSYSN